MIHMYQPMSPYPGISPLFQLYVGDLPLTCQQDTIVQHFSQYGQILDVKLGTNKSSRKFAFVSFSTPDAGTAPLYLVSSSGP